MKSILTFILATFLLFPLQAQEKVYTVDNLPKVHLQNKMQYVCNPAGILSQAACDSIDSMLYALEQQTGIETVVAVVPSIGEEDCFDFCHQLLNKWGVGKKGKNNVNPEKPDVPLNKNDAFQKVQKRRVQENGERGPIQHDQSPPFFFHLNPL